MSLEEFDINLVKSLYVQVCFNLLLDKIIASNTGLRINKCNYEDLGKVTGGMCTCEDKHYFRHLYLLDVVDETNGVRKIGAGAQCLKRLGYDEAFVRRLESVRRLLTRDAETIKPLKIGLDLFQEEIALIFKERHGLGLTLLKAFEPIINKLIINGYGLPVRLQKMLAGIVGEIQATKVAEEQVKTKERIEGYKEYISTLAEIDECIGGRCVNLVNVLAAMRRGDVLSSDELNYVQGMKAKYDKDRYIVSEKAYPYLVFLLGNVTNHCDEFNFYTPPRILQSFKEYMDKGYALSDKQLAVLRSQVAMAKVYEAKEREQCDIAFLPTRELLQLWDGGNRSDDIIALLEARGIEKSNEFTMEVF